VVSLDGAVELDGRSGALGGAADRELLATLRALADVVLVGAGTARSEGYGPVWVGRERMQRRERRGQAPLPTLAVVTRSAQLDPCGRLFVERRPDQPAPPRPVVVTCLGAPAERRRRLEDVAEVLVAGDAEVDLPKAVAELRGRTEASGRILTEGGPRLLGDLVGAGLLDELCLTHSPVIAGPGRIRLTDGWSWPGTGDHPELTLEAVHSGGGQLFARYRLVPRAPQR
jgi:riboflavin biosynthesis pyrimidine reductase